jgi:zinc transport system substrate-binding protein
MSFSKPTCAIGTDSYSAPQTQTATKPSKKHRLVAGVLLMGVLAIGGCSTTPPKTQKQNAADENSAKPLVVASFYPLAFVAERLVNDVATIVNLTPPGVEPHDLEVTPDQAATIEDAALVLTMGQGLQPSVEDAAKRRDSGVVSLLDALGIVGEPHDDDEPKTAGDSDTKHTHDSSEVDPHIWLDPQLLQNGVAEIATALAKVFPESIDDINIRATDLGAELRALDAAYVAGLSSCQGRVLVSSHAAFGRLAKRYGLLEESITGSSPEAEPTADRLAALTDLVKTKGVKTVFAEQLVSTRIAETLAKESGITVAVLDPLESAPKQGDYFAAMLNNLAVLRAGLGC